MVWTFCRILYIYNNKVVYLVSNYSYFEDILYMMNYMYVVPIITKYYDNEIFIILNLSHYYYCLFIGPRYKFINIFRLHYKTLIT